MKDFLTNHMTGVLVELTLIMFAAIGGGIGSLCGMFFWHHKTRKLKFLFCVPCLLVLWIIAGVCIFVM